MIKIQDLAKSLSEKHGISLSEATKFLNTLFEVLDDGLREDKQVKIKGLGTFKITSVKERSSVDVNTGERVVIGSHDKISFTPETSMRDFVNKPFSQFETVVMSEGVRFDDIEETAEDVDAGEDVVSNVEDVAEEEQSPVEVVEISEEKPVENLTENVPEANEVELEETQHEKDVFRNENKVSDESEAVADKFVEIEQEDKSEITELENQEETMTEEHKRRSWILPLAFALVAAASFAAGFFVHDYIDTKEETDDSTLGSEQVKLAPADTATKTSADTVPMKVEQSTADVVKDNQETAGVSQPVTTSPSDYDEMNRKIIYGAYNIVGVSNTVKVRKGQTMKSIAKAYLGGEQMECYIQALNGVSTVQEGQEIKIPELKVRRIKKKN